MLVAVALILLLVAPLCLGVGKSEDYLYKSKEWKDDSKVFVFTKQNSVPDSYLKALLDATVESDVIHFKVLCSTSSEGAAGVVCQALSDHRVALRVAGVVKGLTTPTHGYDSEAAFVTAVLKHLLSSSISELTTYAHLTNYSSQNPHHLVLLKPSDTNSKEYAVLLSAVLRKPLPLAIAMTTNVLPLSHRPQYSRSPPPLRLWYVTKDDSGEMWYPFQGRGLLLQSDMDRSKPLAQKVEEFIERLHYPIIFRYEDDNSLQQAFSGSNVHLAVVFPGLSGASDIEPLALATGLAQRAFLEFAFVLADRSRDSEYGRRLFLTDNKPLPQVILLPYGQENNFIAVDVEGEDLAGETEKIVGILDSFANENPRTHGDHKAYSELVPTITHMAVIKSHAAENKYHFFVYFCARESSDCLNFGYSLIRDLLTVVRRTDLGSSLGAYVVECESVKDIEPPMFETLPGCALYNKTIKKWTKLPDDISSVEQVLLVLSKITGMNFTELMEISTSVLQGASAPSFQPPPSPPLEEEDPLSLVARSLKLPRIPDEIQLSPDSFDQHVSNYSKTAVVFCVKWSVRCKLFTHHILAAHRELDKAKTASVAMVYCDEYTDLCARFHVTSFPTVLLFTSSTIGNPLPLTETLDSTHLLKALDQPADDPRENPLPELTSATLPGFLLGSSLEKTLVLWCGEDAVSDRAALFVKTVSSEHFTNFQYAWMNSTKHARLVDRLLPTPDSLPSVVAVNFRQHTVYHLSAVDSKQFEDRLSAFLTSLSRGELEPSDYLNEKVWLPLRPPIPFPSTNHEHEGDSDAVYHHRYDEDGDLRDEKFEFHFHDDDHHQEPHPPYAPPPPATGRQRHSEL